jgi:hypothetical protein
LLCKTIYSVFCLMIESYVFPADGQEPRNVLRKKGDSSVWITSKVEGTGLSFHIYLSDKIKPKLATIYILRERLLETTPSD